VPHLLEAGLQGGKIGAQRIDYGLRPVPLGGEGGRGACGRTRGASGRRLDTLARVVFAAAALNALDGVLKIHASLRARGFALGPWFFALRLTVGLAALHPMRDRLERLGGALLTLGGTSLEPRKSLAKTILGRVGLVRRRGSLASRGSRWGPRLAARLGFPGAAARKRFEIVVDDALTGSLFRDHFLEPFRDAHSGASRGFLSRRLRRTIDARQIPGCGFSHGLDRRRISSDVPPPGSQADKAMFRRSW
jgi:hypothetical protein